MPRHAPKRRGPRTAVLQERVSTSIEAALIAEQTDYDSVLKWLHGCLLSHSTCYRPPNGGQLPKRLIDVGPTNTNFHPRLVDATDLATDADTVHYLTLSYCWGEMDDNRPPFTSSESSLREREREMPVASMPKTFRQAVEVCRGLGVQYLWIDALCILQDNEADWKSESSRMEHIYRNALCCLVASHASDPHVGLFVTRTPNATAITDRMGEETVATTANHIGWRQPEFVDRVISNNAVGKRAWCLQERYLSPRLLHFTEGGLLKECNNGIENSVTGLLLAPLRSAFHSTQFDANEIPQTRDALLLRLHHDWCEIIQQYRSKTLRRPSDTLPAISGLAREVARAMGDTYLAGHWQSKLPLTLSWFVWRQGIGRPSQEYRAPSWSWASLDNEIMWDMSAFQEEADNFTSVVVDVPKELGIPGNGELVILGPLKPLVNNLSVDVAPSIGQDRRLIFARKGQVLFDNDAEAAENRGRELFWLIIWKQLHSNKHSWIGGGLLLYRDWDEKSHGYIYKRIGYMSDLFDENKFEDAVVRLG